MTGLYRILINPFNMKRIAIVVFLLYTHTAFAQDRHNKIATRDPFFKKAIQKGERFIDSLQVRQDIPGMAICVATREKIVWAEGFGFADMENKMPVTVYS